jgi:REP element-mobilizing transposase RayT
VKTHPLALAPGGSGILLPDYVFALHKRGIPRSDHEAHPRHDFVRTLAEASEKTGLAIHSYCLMCTHLHLVVETPNGNLVAGMRWLLSTCALRFNPRHKRFATLTQSLFLILALVPQKTIFHPCKR